MVPGAIAVSYSLHEVPQLISPQRTCPLQPDWLARIRGRSCPAFRRMRGKSVTVAPLSGCLHELTRALLSSMSVAPPMILSDGLPIVFRPGPKTLDATILLT